MTKRTVDVVVAVTASFRKSGNKTFNVAYIKKALTESQLNFKPKSRRLSYQDWFLYKYYVEFYTNASGSGLQMAV
jgi:hypothetical protein